MAPYICPMHPAVRESEPGKCPICAMALVRQDARFPLLRHLFANPVHLAVMAALMAILMAVAMMLH